MPQFKKLNTKIYPKSGPDVTPDYIYWKQLSVPVLVKEFGPIDYIDFSPIEPYHIAVTCSVRVQVYNPITKLVTKNLSRFRESAYGAVFRHDGKLICAGGEETNIKLFDVSTKSLLRLFKGHTAPVHRTFFVPDKSQIASFSDDKTVRIWDIPTEKNLITFEGHTDYIRAGATCVSQPDIVLSGGYDNIVKLYDMRTNSEVISVNHGAPVESVIFLPSGSIFLSAGGTDIKIWDSISGGKLLGVISQHHKTVTCLKLASDNKRLLSGSLDRHVKIYDINTFKVVHTLDYPNAILSLGVSKNDDTVVAGLVDGLVAIQRRETKEDVKTEKKKMPFHFSATTQYSNVDTIVTELKQDKQAKYDYHLRKFEFSKALDKVLMPYVSNKHPEVTVSVIQELIRRRALEKAFKNRDKKSIIVILRFITKYITDNRFSRVLLDAANIFIDVYQENMLTFSQDVIKLFILLSETLKNEERITFEQSSLEGVIEMLLTSQVAHKTDLEEEETKLRPSENALKNFVIDIS